MATNDNISEYLSGIVSNLPESPGCYQYLDDTGTIIYVGKAKNLKRRVSSYFNREHDNLKTSILVRHIRDIRYIVVNTEEDALLLENNLIKQWKPKYNILSSSILPPTMSTCLVSHTSVSVERAAWVCVETPLCSSTGL